MTAATFDTLKFANTLKAAGVPPQQAEAQAVAFAEVIQLNFRELATKSDLEQLAKATRSDLEQLAKALKSDLEQLAKATKSETEQLGRELRSEIRDESAKLKLEITQIRGELTLIKWMLGVVITLTTVIAVRLLFFR